MLDNYNNTTSWVETRLAEQERDFNIKLLVLFVLVIGLSTGLGISLWKMAKV